MKFKTKNIIFSLLAGLALFLPLNQVLADAPALEVEFQSTPLFNEGNILPGDGVDKWVKVKNNSETDQAVLVQAANTVNSGLGDDLQITVSENSNILYQDTISNFFDEGEIILGTIGSQVQIQYDFNVSFIGESNDSQEEQLGFDLVIGFAGGESVISGGGGGGGGGISGGYVLIIRDEAVILTDSENGLALVIWNTNIAATSQVVYGLFSSGPYTLDLNDPKFGYPFASPEFATKINNHAVTLTGLIPGETYSYRVISKASPATVSFEHLFTMPLPFGSLSDLTEGEGGDLLLGLNSPDGQFGEKDFSGSGDGEDGTHDEELSDEKDSDTSVNQLSAALFALPDGLSLDCLLWIVLAIIIVIVLWQIWKFIHRSEFAELSKKELVKKRNIFSIIVFLLMLIVNWFWPHENCLLWFLPIIIICLALQLVWLFRKSDQV